MNTQTGNKKIDGGVIKDAWSLIVSEAQQARRTAVSIGDKDFSYKDTLYASADKYAPLVGVESGAQLVRLALEWARSFPRHSNKNHRKVVKQAEAISAVSFSTVKESHLVDADNYIIKDDLRRLLSTLPSDKIIVIEFINEKYAELAANYIAYKPEFSKYKVVEHSGKVVKVMRA